MQISDLNQDTEYFLRLFKSQIPGWEVTQIKASQ